MTTILEKHISIKCLKKKQTNQANPLLGDKIIHPENYYRITIAIPYIDSLVINLKEQFLVHKHILKGSNNRIVFNYSLKKSSNEDKYFLFKFFLHFF